MLIHSYLGVLQIKQNQECTPEREPRITMPPKIVARTYYPVSVKNQCHAQHTVTTTIITVIDDLTRVYLKSTGARGSDYINANYIDVSYYYVVQLCYLFQHSPPGLAIDIGIQTQESIHCNTRTNGVDCQ